jgi:hypothetical protein
MFLFVFATCFSIFNYKVCTIIFFESQYQNSGISLKWWLELLSFGQCDQIVLRPKYLSLVVYCVGVGGSIIVVTWLMW